MAKHHRNLPSLVAVLALSGFLRSAPATEPHRQADGEFSYTAGKTLYQSDFSKDDLDGAPWAVQRGQWRVRDGALAGVTDAEENHDAALSLMIQVPEDLLVSLDFRLAADESFSLCFIGGSGPHGRVYINSREFYLWMKAGDSGAARVIDYGSLKLATETWHHLTFIRHGDRLIATVNDQHKIAGRHEKFTPPKKRINLCSETADTRFDNISVARLSEFNADPKLFSRPSYTLGEFWSMREKEYGLVRPVTPKKKKSP